MMKKFLLTICSIIASLFVAFTFTNNKILKTNAEENLTADVTGVEIRMAPNDESSCYFVIKMDEYLDLDNGVLINDTTNYNTLNKIKFYLNEDDNPTYLKSFTIEHWIQNKWLSSGLMFNVVYNEFLNYNGSSVLRIVIEKGCQLPCNDKVYTTNKTYSFKNPNYNNPSYFAENFTFINEETIAYPEPNVIVNGEVSGVQVRASLNDDANCYFVIQTTCHGTSNPELIFDGSKYNTLDKIIVYKSKDDVGVKLSQIITNNEFIANKWSSNGLMIHSNLSLYEEYNGSSTYRITILRGCELPIDNDYLFVTNNDASFINTKYQDNNYKYDGFYFQSYPYEILDFGSCNVIDVNFRSSNNLESVLFLMKLDFNFATYALVDNWAKDLNTLDKISIITVDDNNVTNTISLREIFTNNVTLFLYGEPNAIGFFIKSGSRYTCYYLKAVEIEEGCQIPTIMDGQAGFYQTIGHARYENDDFRKTGKIDGEYDENDKNRIYEEWCNSWTRVCRIKFNCVGLDKIIEDYLYSGEQYLDLTIYAEEGYDLSISKANGNRVYSGLYLEGDEDIYLTLTYTSSQNKIDNNSGCDGSIYTYSLILSTISLCALIFILNKKGEMSNEK